MVGKYDISKGTLGDKTPTTPFEIYDWRKQRRHTIHFVTTKLHNHEVTKTPLPCFDWTKVDGRASFDWTKQATIADSSSSSSRRMSFLMDHERPETLKNVFNSPKVVMSTVGGDQQPSPTGQNTNQPAAVTAKEKPEFDWADARRQRLRKTKSFSDALVNVTGTFHGNRGKPWRGPPSFDWTHDRFDWSQQSTRFDWFKSDPTHEKPKHHSMRPLETSHTAKSLAQFDWSKSARLLEKSAAIQSKRSSRSRSDIFDWSKSAARLDATLQPTVSLVAAETTPRNKQRKSVRRFHSSTSSERSQKSDVTPTVPIRRMLSR